MSLNNFHEQVKAHALEKPEEEVCGFIILNPDNTISVERVKNENPNKKLSFSISPKTFLEKKLNKKILGIYHSHPEGNENPSLHDLNISQELGMPFFIYSILTDNFFLHFPHSFEPDDLLKRPYVKGFYECTCLLKDYFIKELNINITRCHYNYWLPECDKESNRILENVMHSNFVYKQKNELKKHDIIIFKIKKEGRKHVGVYQGDDYFIHQCGNSISQKTLLDKRWQKKIKGVYRHPQLV
jgi:proteasome lid subunit RPN8/RPN11